MTSRLEVVLLGAEIHRGVDGDEVGTATFFKVGDSGLTFIVAATAEQALQLMKSAGTKFVVVVEQVAMPSPTSEGAYRLLSVKTIPTTTEL